MNHITEKQKHIAYIWLHPNGATMIDPECAGGFCYTQTLIEKYPEEKEFIKILEKFDV